jgi:CHASE3 domain sensor protein
VISGTLQGVEAPEQWRERLQREQHVRDSVRVAADRLESAEQERVANIAAAHHAGLSVRQIAAAGDIVRSCG